MKSALKVLTALMAGGVLLAQPASFARAATFDGMTFSMQDAGPGGSRAGGGHDKRQLREARTMQPPPPQHSRERARGQMTEEERRQLHRDLDKASRELYIGGRR
jgi:hypothetical protein